MKAISLITLLISTAFAFPTLGKYQDHQVIRYQTTTKAQLELLESLIKDSSLEIDQWSHLEFGNVDLRIPPQSSAKVASLTAGIPSSVWIPNLQTLVDQETIHSLEGMMARTSSDKFADIFKDYQTTDTYMSFLTSLRGVEEFTMGYTQLGLPIRGVKLGSGNYSIFFNGGVHAREWISPAVVTYIGNFLASADPRAVRMRKLFTFHLVPVVNVEGYAYTRDPNGNRMWRKNREANPGSRCIGTDINRNFGFKWGIANGASPSPCSETYFGQGPWSTKEARALQDYLSSIPNLLSYIDFHSYSQDFLYPWGYTQETSPDNADFIASSKAAVKALKAVHGTDYKAFQSVGLYPTTGTTDDNFYTSLLVKYSITIELRDKGRSGFILPASQIIPSGEETVEAVLAFWGYAREHPMIKYRRLEHDFLQ